jgi:hypothetical protein
MRLKVVLTKGRRATKVGFSGMVVTLFGGSRARRICLSVSLFTGGPFVRGKMEVGHDFDHSLLI